MDAQGSGWPTLRACVGQTRRSEERVEHLSLKISN